MRFAIPLVVFIVLVGFLYAGLSLNPREVPSPLIDKSVPDFELPLLHLQIPNKVSTFSNKDMLGKVWLLNVWASWCVACRQEHPLIVQLANQRIVPIYGLNYRDENLDALAWLDQFGDPYNDSLVDYDGRVGIDFGVYGVPETFVIDKQGIIRYKQIGPINAEALQNKILPLIQELQG